MAGFQVRLLTPTGVTFDGTADQVTASNSVGEFGVLANHTDFVAPLVPCLVTIATPEGRSEVYLVTGGIIEVKQGAVTILADEAVRPAAGDDAELAREIERAEENLAKVSFYEPAYGEAEHAVRLARARLRASEFARSHP